MRQIKQPGPPAAQRIQWVEARGRGFSFTLEAGIPLLDAAHRGFAAEGGSYGSYAESGRIELSREQREILREVAVQRALGFVAVRAVRLIREVHDVLVDPGGAQRR